MEFTGHADGLAPRPLVPGCNLEPDARSELADGRRFRPGRDALDHEIPKASARAEDVARIALGGLDDESPPIRI
jgi:hypothetical protein